MCTKIIDKIHYSSKTLVTYVVVLHIHVHAFIHVHTCKLYTFVFTKYVVLKFSTFRLVTHTAFRQGLHVCMYMYMQMQMF